MKLRARHLWLAASVVIAAASLYLALGRGVGDPQAATAVDRPPRLRPDYADVTIPPNIAPLAFVVEEPGEAFVVRLRGERGSPVEIRGRSSSILIPARPWRGLLEANRGCRIAVEAYARGAGGWKRFKAFFWTVAPEPVDRYLVYRLIRPLYNTYATMGIYQRDLSTYEETCIIHSREFDGGCVNCHTFHQNDPERMLLHIRGSKGLAMLLARGGRAVKVDTRTAWSAAPAAYSSWHPNGQLVAFSVNKLALFFHTAGENRDVFDSASDLAVYLVDSNTVTTVPPISKSDRLETWPAWSADGKYLYFSSAPKLPQERYREVRYDLVRVAFDADAGAWGPLETVLPASRTGLSIQEPRPSPDGRWVLVTMSEYGNFPIYQPSADLYMVDPATGGFRRLACNSPRCDSFHSWSSNGRWIVFSSKRDNEVFARPYFSYIDANGEARKPFVLPQADPTFYDSLIRTYNVPELAKAPIGVPRGEFGRVVCEPRPGEDLKAVLDPAVKGIAPPPEPPKPERDPYATQYHGGGG
jgi:hypothetical protein